MRTLIASLFVLSTVGCYGSEQPGQRRVFASSEDMTRAEADGWCESRGGVLADTDDPASVIDACDTPEIGYGWCWVDAPESGSFILALDGTVYSVADDFRAPAACITFR